MSSVSFRKQVSKLYCHKCGVAIHKESYYCSNCGAKVGEGKTAQLQQEGNGARKRIWIFPAATLIISVIALSCFYIYEAQLNNKVEAMVKKAEAKALQGDLDSAVVTFGYVLQNRPNHTATIFNFEVIERGQHYEQILGEVISLAQSEQFDDALRILENLEQNLAKEEGLFFVRLKEKASLKAASLTVESVGKVQANERVVEDLEALLDKTVDFTSEAAEEITDLLKEKIVNLAIGHSKKHLVKNQFTEAMLDLDRGLSSDPTNEKLIAFQETVKEKQLTFKKEEQKRIEKARTAASEQEHFNWNEAIEALNFEFRYEDEELTVSGVVKNRGTRPIAEVDAHFIALNEDGNKLERSWTSVTPAVLMPNKEGSFEVRVAISEEVDSVEIIDFYWTVK